MMSSVKGGAVLKGVKKSEEFKSSDRGGSGDMTDLKSEPVKKTEKESSPSVTVTTASPPTPNAWSSKLQDSSFYKNDMGRGMSLGIGDGDKAAFPMLSGCSSAALTGEHSDEKDGQLSDEDQDSTSVSQTGKKYIITKRNLIVNYLPQTFTDRQLFNLFVGYGAIDSVKIMRDATTGYSYGFGFVNFVTEEDGIRARSEMNGTQVENKRIKVSFARPPSDDIKDTNLYVTNLPRSMSEEDLFGLFAPFGEIVQRKLLVDRYTNLPRGVAFIRFERRDQAAAAINALNNYVPQGAEEPIRIRLAEDHGKQKAAYLAGFRAGMGLPNGPSGGGGGGGGGGHSKPMAQRPVSWNAYPGKRSVDAWNYERRNRGPACNPMMDGYWTNEGAASALPPGHFMFPGGSHSEPHPYCESSEYAPARKRKRFR